MGGARPTLLIGTTHGAGHSRIVRIAHSGTAKPDRQAVPALDRKLRSTFLKGSRGLMGPLPQEVLLPPWSMPRRRWPERSVL